MEIITQYYGIDWLASIFAILMIYNLGNQNPLGFAFGVAANISWIGFAIMTHSMPIIACNIIFLMLNIRGITKWKRSPRL